VPAFRILPEKSRYLWLGGRKQRPFHHTPFFIYDVPDGSGSRSPCSSATSLASLQAQIVYCCEANWLFSPLWVPRLSFGLYVFETHTHTHKRVKRRMKGETCLQIQLWRKGSLLYAGVRGILAGMLAEHETRLWLKHDKNDIIDNMSLGLRSSLAVVFSLIT